MEAKELSIVLASLIHDVGKMYRRTGRREAHEKLSKKFVERHIPRFSYKEDVLRIVRDHHHEVSEEDTKIVKLADSIPASEREVRRDLQEEHNSSNNRRNF
mgnify:CR=1 FL=1